MSDLTGNSELYRKAAAMHRAGRLEQAERLYRKLLKDDPRNVSAMGGLANLCLQLGRLEEGIQVIDRSLAVSGDQPYALNNRGIALWHLGRLEAALLSFERAMALKPDYADAFRHSGDVLHILGRREEALISYDRALALRPDSPDLHNKRGNVLSGLKRPDQALRSYEQAVTLKPDFAAAFNNLGRTLVTLNRRDKALASFERAIALQPDFAEALNNRGSVLYEQGHLREALRSIERAIALKADFAEAYNNHGNILYRLGRLDQALSSFDRAISLKRDYALAHSNRGSVLDDLGRPDEARLSCERAFSLQPDIAYLRGIILYLRSSTCDMSDRDRQIQEVIQGIERGERATMPFFTLSIPCTPAQQQRCAEIYVRDNFPCCEADFKTTAGHGNGRIRLGYFSADFYQHATAYLTAELFELHDRSTFEVIGYSIGESRNDAMRDRLARAFDRFEDVSELSDEQIAQLARKHGIDIGIDLKGYTKGCRPGIFAHRAAPIQVNYLGYPGTMGADFIDYIIADAVLIPEEHRENYSEKIVLLPDSYQVNDRKRNIARREYTRGELGLPESGFVFCAFHVNWKVTPDLFSVWMRILDQLPGSVLWLLAKEESARGNLRAAAERSGIDPARLCFATHVKNPDHLARHRAADLFLDAFICNAHTTASDALWAGLPVLTCSGGTFAARVAASLLTAIGLPELITHSPAEYEALALELATQPEKLQQIRRKLGSHRLTQPLFDTPRFTRNIEAAYQQMWLYHQQGRQAEHIYI